MIDLNELIPGQTRFKWSDALYLHRWHTYCEPNEAQKENIIKVCEKLNLIWDLVGPFHITSFLRPEAYNTFIGGAKNSCHLQGMACDFFPEIGVDKAKNLLIPKLEEWNIRMERNTDIWVHIDLKFPGPSSRYF